MIQAEPAGRSRRGPRAPRERQSARWRKLAATLANYQSGGLLIALIVMSAVFTAASANFLTRPNLTVVLLQVSVVGLVAIPGAMLVLSGYVDLSVGSLAVLAVAVFGQMAKVDHHSLALSIAIAVLVVAAWGLMNGLLISYLNFSPIIVTLAGFAGARGMADTITHDVTQFGDTFAGLLQRHGCRHPGPGCDSSSGAFLVGAYIWYEMPLGRHMTAYRRRRLRRARSAGQVGFPRPHVFSATAAAVGGLMPRSWTALRRRSGRARAAGPDGGALGGVAFAGGRGSLWGAPFGIPSSAC